MPRLNPDVPVELGGQLRTLKLNLNAFAAFEEKTGFQLDTIAEVLKSGAPKLRLLLTILWSLLVTDEPALALEDVGAMVTLENIAPVLAAVKQIFPGRPAAGPATEAAEAVPLPAAPASAGTGSSHSAG